MDQENGSLVKFGKKTAHKVYLDGNFLAVADKLNNMITYVYWNFDSWQHSVHKKDAIACTWIAWLEF